MGTLTRIALSAVTSGSGTWTILAPEAPGTATFSEYFAAFGAAQPASLAVEAALLLAIS